MADMSKPSPVPRLEYFFNGAQSTHRFNTRIELYTHTSLTTTHKLRFIFMANP